MKLSFALGWTLVRKSVAAWFDDYAASMGAALSYYTLFSIAPLLIIVIAVAGFAFGQDAVRGEIASQLSGLLGAEAALGVEGLVESASQPTQGAIAAVISVIVLAVGATTVFAELQSALDRIWRVPAPPTASGVWTLLRTRVFSFGLVLGLGFVLLVSLVASAGLSALGSWWGESFKGWGLLLQVVNFVVSFGLITGVFAMIYKIMPRATIAWSDVWIGAVVTALLFDIGKLLIGLYIGKSALTSGYGAAGSLVVLLIWVYYSAQIFLLGAEFTWVYACEHGSRVGLPSPVPTLLPPGDAGDAKDTPIAPPTRAPTTTGANARVVALPASSRPGGPLARVARRMREEPIATLKVLVALVLITRMVVREVGSARRETYRSRHD